MNPEDETKKGAQERGGGKAERFTKSGFILSAIGSSVGLGNMWKFPYITGKHGGAAFFILFIVCLILVGLPLLLAEMAIGRGGRGDAATAFVRLSGNRYWGAMGLFTVITAFAIMAYYTVVAGWTIHYTLLSFSGSLFRGSGDYSAVFSDFAAGYWPLFWQAVVMLLCGTVIARGVSGGIEKFNKILIPGFLILLLILMVRSLTLSGASAGVSFFLEPDFSKLDAESTLIALGHAFFSLSLGMGCMLTYGSYVQKEQSLGQATLAIGGGDLLYAFIAGLVIFPTVFSFGLEPDEGVGLAFMALPAAFSEMPAGFLFGGLFFLLLAIAALTSAISILEVPVAYAMNKWGWKREKAAVVVSGICFLVGVPTALSVGGPLTDARLFGRTFFDLFDFATAYIMMPLGGLVVTLFTGYVWKRVGEEAGLRGAWFSVWLFLLRVIIPIVIVLIFLYSTGLLQL